MPEIPEHLCENSSPRLTVSTLSKRPCSMPPSLLLRHGVLVAEFSSIAKNQVFHVPNEFQLVT